MWPSDLFSFALLFIDIFPSCLGATASTSLNMELCMYVRFVESKQTESLQLKVTTECLHNHFMQYAESLRLSYLRGKFKYYFFGAQFERKPIEKSGKSKKKSSKQYDFLVGEEVLSYLK